MNDTQGSMKDGGSSSKKVEFAFEAGNERIKQLEALIKKKKHELSMARRKTENKLKIILGSYFLADKKRFEGLLRDSGFQTFLSAKDKDFIRAAVSSGMTPLQLQTQEPKNNDTGRSENSSDVV